MNSKAIGWMKNSCSFGRPQLVLQVSGSLLYNKAAASSPNTLNAQIQY